MRPPCLLKAHICFLSFANSALSCLLPTLLYNADVFTRWRVLAIIWAVLGVANLVRAGMTLYVAPVLTSYPLSVPLPLLGGLYSLWGVIFLATALFTWRRAAAGAAFKLALIYQAVLWLLHGVGDRSDYVRSLWLRDVCLTLVFLALIAFLAKPTKLFRKSPKPPN